MEFTRSITNEWVMPPFVPSMGSPRLEACYMIEDSETQHPSPADDHSNTDLAGTSPNSFFISNKTGPGSVKSETSKAIRSPPDMACAQISEDSPTSSTRSDDTEPVEEDEEIILVLAKHRLLKRLMQEFYSMLSQATKEVPQHDSKSATGPATASSQPESHGQKKNFSSAKGKRRMQDRDSPPPDGNDNRRNRSGSSPDDGNKDRLYACPFFKYNPWKYTCTTSTRSKYRTCAGPGFVSIARLK